MQRKAVKVTWWRVSSASNFNWNKTRANFSFRTYIIPVAPWRFSLLIVGYDIGGLANYEEAPWGYSQAEWERQEKYGLVRRDYSRSFHVDYMWVSFQKKCVCFSLKKFFSFSYVTSVARPSFQLWCRGSCCKISCSICEVIDPFFFSSFPSTTQKKASALLLYFKRILLILYPQVQLSAPTFPPFFI